jgi:hypothetical protein
VYIALGKLLKTAELGNKHLSLFFPTQIPPPPKPIASSSRSTVKPTPKTAKDKEADRLEEAAAEAERDAVKAQEKAAATAARRAKAEAKAQADERARLSAGKAKKAKAKAAKEAEAKAAKEAEEKAAKEAEEKAAEAAREAARAKKAAAKDKKGKRKAEDTPDDASRRVKAKSEPPKTSYFDTDACVKCQIRMAHETEPKIPCRRAEGFACQFCHAAKHKCEKVRRF